MATKDEGKPEDTALAPMKIGVPKMLITLEEAKKRISEFVELKKHIIMADEANFVRSTRNVQQDDGSYKTEPYSYIRKPGWQLIDAFFGIQHQLLDKFQEIHEGAGWFDEVAKIPQFTQHVRYRTILPDGRYVDHEGACSTLEKRFAGKYKDKYGVGKIFHDTLATAETRCTNRGTSHIVGAGEVSAEEADAEQEATPKPLPDKEKAAREAAKNMGKIICTNCRTSFATYELLNAHKEKEKH